MFPPSTIFSLIVFGFPSTSAIELPLDIDNADLLQKRYKNEYLVAESYQFIPEEKFYDDVIDELLETHKHFNSTALRPQCISDLLRIQNASRSANLRHATKDTVLSPDENLYLSMEYSSGALTRRLFHSGYLDDAGNLPMCLAIDQQIIDNNKIRHIRGKVFKVFVAEQCIHDRVFLARASMFICLPWSCTERGLTEISIKAAYARGNKTDGHMHTCSVRDINKDLPPVGVGRDNMITFLLAFVSLCLISGAIDSISGAAQKKQCLFLEIFFAFSFYRNMKYIFEPKVHKDGHIKILDCLRALSMLWIIAGHHTLFFWFQGPDDFRFMGTFFTIPTEFLSNAFFAVDTFFFLSGMLLVYMWFNRYKKNRSILSWKGWLYFYAHRLFRLSPPYYIMVFFYTYMFSEMLRNKPNTMLDRYDVVVCPNNYMYNLLYVNNYVFAPEKDEMCFDASWYLAADMQIFVFTPILLFLLARHPKHAHIAIGLIFGASTIANIVTVWHFHFPESASPLGLNDPDAVQLGKYGRYIYNAPYIRCQIYLMGMIVGYIIQAKPAGRSSRLFQMLSACLWPLAVLMLAWIVIAFYPYHTSKLAPIIMRALYSAFSKVIWGFGLTFIVLACHYGYGGPIESFMSWHIWAPLGRLSFATYLVHSVVIKYVMGISNEPLRYMGLRKEFVFRFVPIVALSFMISVFYSAFFELPFIKLEQAVTSSFGRRSNRQALLGSGRDDEEEENGRAEDSITIPKGSKSS